MRAHQVPSYVAHVTAADRSDQHYEIRVAGRLAPRWSAWFDGMDVAHLDDGTTSISGRVADQAALHGVLQKLRDVGIPLLSLTHVQPHAPTPDQGDPT